MLRKLMSRLTALFVSTLLGCAGASGGEVPANAETTVLSFRDLDSGDCGGNLARALSKTQGVYKIRFDKRKAELTVYSEPGLDVLALALKHKPNDEPWTLIPGAGKGSYLAWAPPPREADVKEIAVDGVDIPSLEPFLAEGRVTLFDFSAKWCGPCRSLDQHVVKVLASRTDVAYRKLDIADWDTPLAKHYMAGVAKLPYIIVYDKAGKRIDAIAGLDTKRLDVAIDKAAGTSAGTGK